jgi:hypothetical protein
LGGFLGYGERGDIHTLIIEQTNQSVLIIRPVCGDLWVTD